VLTDNPSTSAAKPAPTILRARSPALEWASQCAMLCRGTRRCSRLRVADNLRLRVADNLGIMHERAVSIGASVTIESRTRAVARGVRITARE
jgi:hypothetical protein